MDKEKTTVEKNDLLNTFHSQFDSNVPPLIQRTSCGIASLYMGLKYFGKEVGDYPNFLRKFIEHGSFNIPVYSMNMKIGGIETKVPISYFGNNTTNDEQEHLNKVLAPFSNLKLENRITREINPNANPRRAFTIEHGFDHRGIDSFIREGLNIDDMDVTLIEGNQLPDNLSENSILLASVMQNKLGYPARLTTFKSAIATHVIPIVGIGTLNETNVALYADSAFLTPQDGLQVRTLDTLNDAFAGKYTIITEMS